MAHNSQYLDQKSKQSSSTQPYIGAHVTLISSLDVRYEGVLFTIDPNESTVALQEVRCLGTEERQTGEKAIEKSDTVYEFIIFRGENIKSICLSNKGQKQNKKPINDPSIIKVGEVREPSRKTVTPMPSGQESNTLRPQQSYDSYQQREPQQYQPHRRPQQHWSQHRQPQRNNHYNNRRQHHQQYNNNYNPQRRGYNNYQHRRGGYNRNYNQGPRGGYRRRYNNKRNPENQPGNAKFLAKGRDEKDKFETEFDFDASNARFDKTDVLEQPVVEVVEEKEENVEEVPAVQPAETTEESTEAAVPAAVPAAEESENVTEKVEEEAEKKADPAKEALKLVYTYKAENFFDDLDTNDTEQRVSDLKTRRKLDAETFGEEARTYSPKVYRRRRYRNKGGRYNNNNRRYNNHYNRRGGYNNYNNRRYNNNYNNYNNQRYNNYNNNQNHNQGKKESVEPESAV